MKFGTSLYCQNYPDWDRFNAGQFGPGPATPDHVKVLEDVKVGELADDLGFDRIWSIEHHFTPYTMVPSVTQFLAYFAGKVKNAGVGTMVIVLPWHEPLRVAEQIALLDILLQGRSFAIGFGRGAARREFEGLRIPMSESRDRFVESAKIVKMALSQERFSYDGEFYKIPEISIRPQPMNKNLTDNMYCAAQSRQSVNMAADADLRLIVVPQKDWDEYSDDIRVYNIRRREQGMEARRPIVGCNVYCTNDLDDAQETFWDAVHDHAMSAIHHYELDEPEHLQRGGRLRPLRRGRLQDSRRRGRLQAYPQPHPDMGHPGNVLRGHPGNPGEDPPRGDVRRLQVRGHAPGKVHRKHEALWPKRCFRRFTKTN